MKGLIFLLKIVLALSAILSVALMASGVRFNDWYFAVSGIVLGGVIVLLAISSLKFYVKRDKNNFGLKEHPKVCPNCKEVGSVTYERFSLDHGEYVCDECGWGMDAVTGEITFEGE